MELKSVGGYIRVSTQEQSQKGLSLESQQADINDYCRRMGYQLTKIYVDKGITARKNLYKRAAFMEMMQDVQDHKINHIVILRLDRFFRNVYDYHRMMHKYLEPNGCGWSAVKEDYDTTTTNGRLMINLRLSIAEQECDQDSDRIKDIFSNRIKDGFVVSGSLPIGYRVDENKRLVPDDNAGIIKDVFETYLRVNSISKTRLIINDKYGWNYEYTWYKRCIKKEIYTGKKRDNENYCEPIVSKELFDEVNRNAKNNIRLRQTNHTYVFSGLLKCGECGKALVGHVNTNRKIYYYRCNNPYMNHNCNHRNYYDETKIEQYLLDNVENLLKNYVIEIEAKEKSVPRVNGNREQIQKKIDRLTDLFINGVIGMDELKQRKASLEAQIIEDVAPPKTDLSAVNAFLNSGFRNIYNDLTIEEKQSLWRSVIKEIVLNNKEIVSVIFL